MVFESIVADLLNRFLGDYVENLDSSQLKIGIWGGDVVLQDLVLKDSALAELDLPVKTVYGRLGKLVLKIPWKNLYSAPVEATIERLFLLVVPQQEIIYDPKKEEKYKQELKQSELLKIEEAKKAAREKDLPKPPSTFVEKMATQIIKNVQVSIKDIHIRYEDKFTNPQKPFSLGITLHNLSAHTVDKLGQRYTAKEEDKFFFKLLNLEGLAVYWNCNTRFYSYTGPSILNEFQDNICSKSKIPNGYQYMLGPINASSHLKLNPKPELDGSNFTIPKLDLKLTMEKLSLSISKAQYQDILELIESVDYMMRASQYRRYRPNVNGYRGNYKVWWKFAYNCILEEQVLRKKRDWDWKHIIQHRQMCKKYADLYKTKLSKPKVSAEITEQIRKLEDALDVFNIVLIRQTVEMEVEWLLKQKEAETQKRGWFSGWWSSSPQKEEESSLTAAEIVKKFGDAMTPEEKAKLYRAIDYQENAAPTHYPEEFVAVNMNFSLNYLELVIKDDVYDEPRVVHAELKGVHCSLQQRPTTSAIKTFVKIKAFTVYGLRHGTVVPHLISSKLEDDSEELLNVLFETNPLDNFCDQRVHVYARPLQVVYDADTVNKLADVFTPPKSDTLSQIQAAAGSKLADLKEMSTLGVQYAIDQHSILDLKVNIMSSYVIMPHGGFYTGNEDVLIINLGHLKMQSMTRSPSSKLKVKELHDEGHNEEHILKLLLDQAYDRFIVELKDIQVMMVFQNETWENVLESKEETSLKHILQPTSLKIFIDKCLIMDDPRLPKIKINGTLPNISVSIVDDRLLHIIGLLNSITFPGQEEEELPLLQKGSRASSMSALSQILEHNADQKKIRELATRKVDLPSEQIQRKELDVKFVMGSFEVKVIKYIVRLEEMHTMLDLKVVKLEMRMLQRTFDMKASLKLGGISLDMIEKDGPIRALNTPMTAGDTQDYLFTIHYVNANRKSPDFHSAYGSVVQLVEIQFSRLTITLHQEALVTLLEYAADLQREMQAELNLKTRKIASAGNAAAALTTIKEDGDDTGIVPRKSIKSIKRKRESNLVEVIDFKIKAILQNIDVHLANRCRMLADFMITDGVASVIVKKSYTEITARLRDVLMNDPNPQTLHHKILSIDGDEAFYVNVVMYNLDIAPTKESINMSIKAQLARVKFFYLNWFISTLLNFLNTFSEAQEKIVNAAAEAAEAAKQNVQIAYTKAVKIALDIALQAPVVVVPMNSSGFQALAVDFGELTLKNHFIPLPVTNEQGFPAILDELWVELKNMKISNILLSSDGSFDSDHNMLEPLSFRMLIKRNISASWYQQIPDLDMSGRLKTVRLSLSQDDYCLVMKILNGNLAEGAKGDVAKLPAPVAPTPKWNDSVTSGRQTAVSVAGHVAEKSVTETGVIEHISIKFTFTMDNLIIDLLTERKNQTSDRKSDLATFALHVLSMKGYLYSNGTISMSLLLVDCLLDDTRIGSENKLTRFMERKPDAGEQQKIVESNDDTPYRSMLDVTFKRKGIDTFLDVKIFSFNLILSMDYLLQIANFFAIPELQENEMEKDDVIVNVKDRDNSKARQSTKTELSKLENNAEASTSMMTINLRVEKPDIILVENLDQIDTNAIILNTEITLKLRLSTDHQVISGCIKDLELYSCCYNPAKRAETMAQILRPCTLTLAGSTPAGEGLHCDLVVTDIRLSVSPGTIALLSQVQRALYASDEASKIGDLTLPDHSNLWEASHYEESEFWFMATEMGEDIASTYSLQTIESARPLKEMCIISAPSIIITVEAGVGNQTLPMVLLEMNLQGAVNNWSSQLNVDSSMNVQMAYYNSRLALWEPLIEPVEVIRDGRSMHTLWELTAEVQMNKPEQTFAISPSAAGASDYDEVQIQPAAMSIVISSKENLEITMTKTCLEVLTNLGKAFQTAYQEGLSLKQEPVAPYLVRNDTGLQITLLLKQGKLKLVKEGKAQEYKEVLLENGAEVGVCVDASESSHLLLGGILQGKIEDVILPIKVKVQDRTCELNLPITRADKRYFSLNHRGEGNDPWGLISDVTVKDGGTVVTLRSVIQVHNHFNEPVNVYYMTKRGNEVECIGTVETDQNINLPLHSIYTPTNELFFSVKGYSVSVKPFIWKELQNTICTAKLLQCDPKSSRDRDPYFMNIVGEMEQVYYETTTRHTMVSTCYNINLRPAVLLKNFLPVDLIVLLQETANEINLKPGGRTQIATAEPGKSVLIIRIPEYLEKEWVCTKELQANPPDFGVWTFDSYDSVQKMSLDLGMHVVQKNGSIVMTLYCPFWMINKTGMMLSYRQSDETANVLYHPEDFKGPILFSFKPKSFFGKKKATVKIEDGEWSDKFSLDVAGSSGIISCKAFGMIYQIGVQIQLTYSGLTKQVVFTPYHVLINNASYAIEVQEMERPADPWTKVEPDACTPLWPHTTSSNKMLRLRVAGTNEISSGFSCSTLHTTLLKLPNMYGGVNVDVAMTEGAVYITFTQYEPGFAPALLINNTDLEISLKEKGEDVKWILKPMHKMMYTWCNPSGPRLLLWHIDKKKEVSDELRKDGIGEVQVTPETTIYWTSFLDGVQRILLFTKYFVLAAACNSAGEMERIDREITVSIHGMGLSFVNNLTRQELMYIGIASSGVIWEAQKTVGKRFKPLSIADCQTIEQAYVQYQREVYVGRTPESRMIIDNKIEVDFEKEMMFKPNVRNIRRTYNTGLWLQMKTSPLQLQLHAKVNRIQIDHQIFGCLFPVVLAPVPLPKSVAANNAHKPFAEVSIVQRIMQHSTVQQYKYFKVLIQEFHIKIDMGFINGVVSFFSADELTDVDEANQFGEDLKLVDKPLLAHVSLQSSQEQKNFYDLLHFSPLKIHLSFSLSGGDSNSKSEQEMPLFLSVLLQSFGVTLTDLQDVVFKLAYFERDYTFLTQKKLMSEVTMHYVGQAIKQLYVLVLGLDVLGNPYGLVVGFTKGVEDLFYEPFQGAIQGPGEFAEGLVLGVRSLFGHTVGGAAGAVSRITGAMGKGIAALTFDKDYQRKRRQQMNQRPTNVQTGLARSGKGLVMGVVDGVSGVFLKPISGAKEEGVEGFFKGVGKGVVGLVTRPATGVIDFASGSLDAVKRVTEMSEEVTRLRPPRFLNADGLVRPYVRHEADGNKLLHELEKGRYASTDEYIYHTQVMANSKDVIMLTDKRLMYIVHNDIFGGWQMEWGYTWESINAPPRVVDKGIFISAGEPKKKVLGLFGSGESGKVVFVTDKTQQQYLIEKMGELMRK